MIQQVYDHQKRQGSSQVIQVRSLWDKIKFKEPHNKPLLKPLRLRDYQEQLITRPLQIQNRQLNHSLQNSLQRHDLNANFTVENVYANDEVDDYSEDPDFEDYHKEHHSTKNKTQLEIIEEQPSFQDILLPYQTFSSNIYENSAPPKLSQTNTLPSRSGLQQQQQKLNRSVTQSRNGQSISKYDSYISTESTQQQRALSTQTQFFNRRPQTNQSLNSALDQFKVQSLTLKQAFEPGAAQYNIRGQFEKMHQQHLKRQNTEKSKQKLQQLCTIKAPGPGYYIDNRKYTSLQKRGHAFGQDMRIFDKMTLEEIKNKMKQRQKKRIEKYCEESVYGSTNINNSTMYADKQNESPDPKRQSFSFPRQTRLSNVRSWDLQQVRNWPRVFHE